MHSPDFHISLLEAIAVVIHNLAVHLFKELHGSCKHDPIPILHHSHFQNVAECPEGVKQMVGYWAETELFGGVVLDRSGNETKVVSRAIIFLRFGP